MARFLSIRTKLAIAFGAAFCMIAGIGAFSMAQLDTVNSVTSEIREVWLPKLQSLATMREELVTYDQLSTRRTQNLDFRLLAEIGEEMAATVSRFEVEKRAFAAGAATPEEGAAVAGIAAAFEGYVGSVAEVLRRIESGEVSAALAQFGGETQTFYDLTHAEVDELAALAEAQTADAERRAQEVEAQARLLIIGAMVGAMALTLAGVVWVSTSISSPLLKVSRAMQRLTAGDEDVKIDEGGGRDDEIGILVTAVRGFRDSVIRSRDLATVAETDRRRLQAAIANLPVGFCMFDEQNRLIVSNDKFAELYRLPADATLPGTPHERVVEARIAAGTYNGSDPVAYAAGVSEVTARQETFRSTWELQDGRAVSTIFQPMPGGWLATHEDITDRRRAEARIRHMARHDALTDLPNRTLFGERIEEALKFHRKEDQLAVLAIDLDRFKSVNDSLGHPAGDKLLQAVAGRLRETVRDTDTVARFGGDEFAVVQLDPDQPAAARSLADRIVELLSTPFQIDEHVVSIGASVGVAIAPADGDSAERLLQNADMALYRAKTDGRGVYRFFESEMDARMQVRRELEKDLREAIARRDFILYYQPIVNLDRKAVSGVEALLRWKHPTRGIISPGEFIPLAEETGLIVPMGEWALKQACADAATWPENISVAVNLSPVQFRSRRLPEVVMSALALSGLAPGRLELEITEGVLLSDSAETLDVLHRLRAIGVRIAMDDFGTGYSSLSYLQSFPFDKIKIDASFVRRMGSDPSSMAIVRAVTGLGESLGMGTTAEGVETAEQLEQVRAQGCTEVQGYVFSEARPVAELDALIVRLNEGTAAAA
ncbi:MAG TPA: EAL domain-containing protein [Devosiaceae bacterium]|nr:EAL domain-containing protein [Devosiaceae bacterium]